MFGNDRNQLRKVFYDSWMLRREGKPMDAMQEIVANIVELHPEYHATLENNDAIDKDFSPDMGESNPFLHMSMHIALHEQISTNRPAGIRDCYTRIIKNTGSEHDAEHAMMDCLGESLWLAQRNQTMPDEVAYLKCLKALQNKSKHS